MSRKSSRSRKGSKASTVEYDDDEHGEIQLDDGQKDGQSDSDDAPEFLDASLGKAVSSRVTRARSAGIARAVEEKRSKAQKLKEQLERRKESNAQRQKKTSKRARVEEEPRDDFDEDGAGGGEEELLLNSPSGEPLRLPSHKDVLPAKLLSVLGSLGSPSAQLPQDDADEGGVKTKVTPKQVESAKRKKKIEKKLSELWDTTGVKVEVLKEKPDVSVQMPESMQEFLRQSQKDVPRHKLVIVKRNDKRKGKKK